MTGGRGQRTEDRGQRAEDKGQRTEDRARELGLIGFVFLEPEGGFIFIILCGKDGCIRFCP